MWVRADLRRESVAPQLKLIALDADDLAVISAHVQDARVQTADIIWRQGEKRLVVGIEFHSTDAPSGCALLMFSQGGALRLDVECLECELTDLGTDDLGTGDMDEDAEPPGQDA